jgi:uncharacterized protein YkwD
MKKITIVLTITALAAALVGRPAQALPTSLAAYNQTIASAAVAASPSSLEQGLLTAINAQRVADGASALTWDPALAAAARYQEDEQVAIHYSGEYAFLADGATKVTAPQMAAAFGSSAANVAEGESSSVYNPAAYGNPTAMVTMWKPLDPTFASMLGSSTPNACGISIVTYALPNGSVSYRWAIFFGTDPAPAAPAAPAVTIPANYNQTIASAAVAATPSSLEQGLLTAINNQRAADGASALTWDPALAAAARYQEDEQVAIHYSGEYAFLADGATKVTAPQMAAAFGSSAANVAEGESSSVYNPAAYGNPTAMVTMWKPLDPTFASMLGSSTPNACGISIVTYALPNGSVSYRWAIFFGTDPSTTAPAAPTGPKLNTSSLNAALAAAALTTPASANEAALLAGINAHRTLIGAPTLVPDAGLMAAAHYQASDDMMLGKISLLPTWAYQADGSTEVNGATLASDFASATANVHDYMGTNAASNGAYLSFSPFSWATQSLIWQRVDPTGFGATVMTGGAYNACGIAIVTDGTEVYKGVTYSIMYYVVLVGHK